MALLDLSRVTRALQRLLIEAIAAPPFRRGVSVTAAPPSALSGSQQNTLSLYLYHVQEDPHYRNQLPQPSARTPVRHAPMALQLYYVLTAHHHGAVESDSDLQVEQELFGYALKVLHDHPRLDDATRVGTSLPVLTQAGIAGSENRLEIQMRTVKVEDALQFWANDDNHAPRLSAYYEVRVVMLEPEAVTHAPLPVLRVGPYVMPSQPVLLASHSLVAFSLPAALGGSLQTVSHAPAVAPLLDAGSASSLAPEHRRVTVSARGLHGQARQLLLRGEGARVTLELDASGPGDNSAWAASASQDELRFEPRTTVFDVETGGSVALVPGTYAVRVSQSVSSASGSERRVTSDAVSIGLAPYIRGVQPGPAVGQYDVLLAGDYLTRSSGGEVMPRDLELSVQLGEDMLRDQRYGSLSAGGFQVHPGGVIRIWPDPAGALAGASSTDPLYLAVRVNGVASAPFWWEAP